MLGMIICTTQLVCQINQKVKKNHKKRYKIDKKTDFRTTFVDVTLNASVKDTEIKSGF